MVLLISYDLNAYERPSAYAAVKSMIENRAASFKKPLYSQWLVETQSDAETWSTWMKNVTDSNDKWLIVQVRNPYQGWLDASIWGWLRTRL